jgi:hypothetical protein
MALIDNLAAHTSITSGECGLMLADGCETLYYILALCITQHYP